MFQKGIVRSFFVLLFFVAIGARGAVPQSERDALAALFNATGGPSWANNTNWNGAPGTECTWFGIMCDPTSSNVTQINLHKNNLAGTLPQALTALSKLTIVNVSNNTLTGPIPSWLGSMTSLTDLVLNGNDFSGPIPTELGNLVNLRSLGLGGSQLSGSIPESFAALKNIQSLQVVNAGLTGPFPAAVTSMTGLQWLDLSSNNFSGGIPPDIGNLTNLTSLGLSNDHLSGSIPAEIGNLRSLTELVLDRNSLSGPIPSSIGNLTALQTLWIPYNHLTGAIPPELGQLVNLQELQLFFNDLSGPIPKELGNLTNVTLIQLDGENFNTGGLTGNIPPELGALKNLQYFSAAQNKLSGPFPTSTFLQWQNLLGFDLQQNHFSGPMPAELAQLTKLNSIVLATNDFDPGPIPPEYLALANLTMLGLGETNRTGTIPSSIGNLTKLQYLRIWGNQLTGTIPPELCNATSLRNLWLQSNNLRGPVPDCIVNLHLDASTQTYPSLFAYNALYSNNQAVNDFLNGKVRSGNWTENTQTVPPTNVTVVGSTPDSITLSWQPIAYVTDPGGYEVDVATTPGGPYTKKLLTTDKGVSSATVIGLNPSTAYYFIVRSVTYPHAAAVNRVFASARNTQTNTIISDASAEVQATTAAPAPTPANVVVTDFPSAMVQLENVGGGTTTYTLTNNGGTSTTITLTQDADFFAQSPLTFVLSPGQTQIVSVAATAKPAGAYEGNALISGTGVPAGTSVRIKLLVSAPTAGPVTAVADSNRVDIAAPPDQNPTVQVSFTNTGTGTLSGILISDAAWAIPPSGIITIPPGQTVTVTITIDRSKRSSDEGSEGSAGATLSLVYLNGSPVSGKWGLTDTPSSGVSITIVTVVDTTVPTATSGAIPPLGANEIALFLPGVGDLQGSVGRFISDIAIVNASGAAPLNNVKLYHFPIGGSATNATSVTISKVAPAQSLLYGNVARTVFKNQGQVGTIQLRSPDATNMSIVANIFNVSSPAGTYGTMIPVFRSDRAIAAGQSLYLTGVVRAAGLTHTNVYIQEASGSPADVTITWYDGSGNVLGTSGASVGAFALTSVGNSAPVGAVLAVVTNATTSTGKVLAYATPVDEKSGDSWDVVDWSRQNGYSYSDEMIIPVGGAAPGANNTYFRTDLSISNIGTQSATGTLTYYPTTGAAHQQSVTLGPLQTLSASDVVTNLLQAPVGVGYFVFTPQTGASFVVSSRTYTTVKGQSATFGTAVPTLSRASGLRVGQSRKIGALDDASLRTIQKGTPATFRTNMGIVETLGKTVTVKATLLYNDTSNQLVTARMYGSTTWTLGPNQSVPINGVTRAILGSSRDANLGDMKNVQLNIEVIDGDGAILFYTSSVDNGTGDATLRTE